MIKVSNKTPVLIILFIITSIAGLIYSPWTDIYDIIGDDIPPFIVKFIFTVIAPTMAETLDFLECVLTFNNGVSMQYTLAIVLKITFYVVVVHIIEKYHSEMHITESIYTICIDIHCIEGISMYLLNISFHILGKIFESLSKNDDLFMILDIIFGLFAAYMLLFMLSYLLEGTIIILVLPTFLALWLDSSCGNTGATIGFIIGVIIGRIVWSIFSDWFYERLLNFTIMGIEVFKIPKAILSFFD